MLYDFSAGLAHRKMVRIYLTLRYNQNRLVG